MIFDPKDEWLYAAFTGDNKQIYSFLSNPRFDINKQDKMGFSALYIASKEGNLETVKLLIESGATVDLNSMDFATVNFNFEKKKIKHEPPTNKHSHCTLQVNSDMLPLFLFYCKMEQMFQKDLEQEQLLWLLLVIMDFL